MYFLDIAITHLGGSSIGVMVCELGWQAIVCEFVSN